MLEYKIPTELSTPHAVATRNRRPNLAKWKRRKTDEIVLNGGGDGVVGASSTL